MNYDHNVGNQNIYSEMKSKFDFGMKICESHKLEILE